MPIYHTETTTIITGQLSKSIRLESKLQILVYDVAIILT